MRRRTAVLCGLIGVVVAVVTVFAVAIARFGASMNGLRPHERAHLDPVAVPASACPSLGVVRVTAARAGQGWWAEIDPDAPPWNAFSAQLEPKLSQFAIVLHAAIPAAPDRVAVRLQKVLHEVEIGRRELLNSTSLYEYLSRTNYAVLDGEQSLSEASDLVERRADHPCTTPPRFGRSRVIRTAAFAIVLTALLALLDFVAVFFIYEWAGGDFGGYGASAHSAAAWALPAWLCLTAVSLVLDVLAIRGVHHWTSPESME